MGHPFAALTGILRELKHTGKRGGHGVPPLQSDDTGQVNLSSYRIAHKSISMNFAWDFICRRSFLLHRFQCVGDKSSDVVCLFVTIGKCLVKREVGK